jgi:hypothetical protein
VAAPYWSIPPSAFDGPTSPRLARPQRNDSGPSGPVPWRV